MKNKGKDRKHTTVSIPVPLYEKIKKLIENTGFTSVSDYVTFVLREVVASIYEEEPGENRDDKKLSKEEEARIKAKLRALGYL